ncbi:MAG: hypothetical protein FGM40_09310 [Rhodocyclaceae bacterium]|nr:hypothetical protein [Rhodocyclaceae bacterium]
MSPETHHGSAPAAVPPNIAEDAFLFRGELQCRDIISAYSGPVTDDLLSGFGNAMRAKLELDETDRRVARSMFSVLVEQVQNIIRYSSEVQFAGNDDAPAAPESRLPHELRFGLVLVGKRGDGTHFVSCSNLVDDGQVGQLDGAIGKLRGLDRKTLGSMMKDALRREPPEGSRGASVGWITVVREATGGFDYGFYPISGTGKTYFTFRAYFD